MDTNYNFFKIISPNIIPTKGMVLVAEPALNDLYFKRSIILLVEHNHESSMGFVLNKLLEITVAEMIEDFPPTLSHLMLGGPVGADSLHFIHTLGELVPNAVHICNSIYWGGDFEILKSLISTGHVKDNQVKFFAGYAGWTAGQLVDELKEETWALTNISEMDIMGSGVELWRKTVEQMDEKYHIWMNYPENPHLN